MNKGKIIEGRKKILVVSGCSHTQGSAFIKKDTVFTHSGTTTFEFASEKLKQKYGKNTTTARWLSDNLTWGGKLKTVMNFDQLINLGFGGFGPEAVIRSVRSYTFHTQDLANHTFVIQIPSHLRKEIIYKKNEKFTRETFSNILHTLAADKFGFVPKDEKLQNFIETYCDADLFEIQGYYELYYLQDYLEAKGATVRFILSPFEKLNIEKEQQTLKYTGTLTDYMNRGFEKRLQRPPTFEKIFNSLNIIDLSSLHQFRTKYMKEPTKWKLSDDNIVPGDNHYNEEGNYALARCIKQNFERKISNIVLKEFTKPISSEVNREPGLF